MTSLKLKKVVLIGASTGGPGQIHKIIQALPKLHNTSVVIAQHMSDGFLASFVHRLEEPSLNPIKLTEDGSVFQNETLYVCEKNIRISQEREHLVFHVDSFGKNSFNPDINKIFHSFVPFCKEIKILCVILTGIGDDGVEASVHLSENGARCITETSQSAIIDGMPSRARELVRDIEVYDIKEIVEVISEFCA